MTSRQFILNNDADVISEMVREWLNVGMAIVDEEGDIWVSDPVHGHWLSAEKLNEFVAWAKPQ